MKASYLQLAANVVALNQNSNIFTEFDRAAPNGLIMAANDANFDGTHMSEPLTEYLVDYPDQDGLQALLDAAFPAVPVGRSFEYLVHDDKEAFQAAINNEDIREIGGKFAEIRTTGTRTDGRTDNKGLVMILDNDQGGEDPAVQQRAVENLRGRLLRTELYRGEALLEANDTVYASPNWKTAGSDPDGSLMGAIDASGDARGVNANIALFGGGAWVKRYLGLGVDANSGKFASRGLTPDQLAQLTGLDKVLVSNFRYQSSATAKTKVVADKVYCYYAKQGAMPNDPSNIKRFITNVPGGGAMRVYIEPMLKRTAICVEHYSRLVLTSSLGIKQLVVTFA